MIKFRMKNSSTGIGKGFLVSLQSRIELRNQVYHGLVWGKGFNVPAAHLPPKDSHCIPLGGLSTRINKTGCDKYGSE